MTLTIDPAERPFHQPHLAVHEEPRRTRQATTDSRRSEQAPSDSGFDAAAPVSVDPETGAALADLHVDDAVPLTTALSRYGEHG